MGVDFDTSDPTGREDVPVDTPQLGHDPPFDEHEEATVTTALRDQEEVTSVLSPEQRVAHLNRLRNALIYQVTGLTLICVILGVTQAKFAGTWDRQCDYDLKVWITVYLGSTVAYDFVLIAINVLDIRKFKTLDGLSVGEQRFRDGLSVVKSVMLLFTLAWFLYGIKPVFVLPTCNAASRGWGLFLWWLEFIVVVVCPCACCSIWIFLLCYVVVLHRGDNEALQPTPMNIKEMLKQTTFSNIKADLLANEAEQPTPIQPATQERPEEALSQTVAAITGVPIPGVSHFRRLQSGVAGSRDAVGLPPAVFGRAQSKKGSISCPICFCEFEDDDTVVVMPCDKRHVFHQACIFTWLDKSQQCPVCRANIVGLLQASSGNGVHNTDPESAV